MKALRIVNWGLRSAVNGKTIGLLLTILLHGFPLTHAADGPVEGDEAAWTGSSYPELPDQPWLALPCYVNWAFEDARGRIWLGSDTPEWPRRTDEELLRSTKASMKAAFTQERPLLAGAEILHQDAAGRIWIRTKGQFCHILGYNGGAWFEFPLKIESSRWNYAVEHLYEDAQGRVWLDGQDAVCRFEKGRFEILERPPELKGDVERGYFSHAAFVASPDGLVMFSAWTAGMKTWFCRDDRLFPIDAPRGEADGRDGWQARWPVDGNAVFHTGFMSHRNRVPVSPAPVTAAGAALPADIRALLVAMDDEHFEVRDDATRKLQSIAWKQVNGRSFVEALLRGGQPSEVTTRLHRILQTFDDPQMSRQIASGPWMSAGLLCSAVPRAGGVVLSWLTVRTPTNADDGEKEEKGVFWVRPDGSRIKVPFDKEAGSNLKVRFDGRGAPLVSEGGHGSFCFRDGAFARATPENSDRTLRMLLAVDARGRAFFKSDSDAVLVCLPKPLPATAWKTWPQSKWVKAVGEGLLWADFETSAVARYEAGQWSAVQTDQGELNGGRVALSGSDGMLLFKGHIRADPDQYWLANTAHEADRKCPSNVRLVDLATQHREKLLRYFGGVRFGRLPEESGQPSMAGDNSGRLWVCEPIDGRTTTLALITAQETRSLEEEVKKAFPGFETAEQVVRLPGLDGVVLLHHALADEEAFSVPLHLCWTDSRLDVRPLFPWRERYAGLRPYSVFLTADGALHLGKGGDPGTICVRDGLVEFLPDERPPVLEHPHGTLWYQDLTREGFPRMRGLRALVVRCGARSWRVPLRSTATRSLPVVDRKGLVWIALGNGVTGMRVSDQGVHVIHEVPWDLPGRTVYTLAVDAQNRLWCHDAAANEALCLELDALPEK